MNYVYLTYINSKDCIYAIDSDMPVEEYSELFNGDFVLVAESINTKVYSERKILVSH